MIRYREIVPQDADVLEDFLYLALHQTDLNQPIPRAAVREPQLAIYTSEWGAVGDAGFVAMSIEGDAAGAAGSAGAVESAHRSVHAGGSAGSAGAQRVVGAAWARILSGEVPGYGNVDENTPEFAISVRPEFRRRGIGEELLNRLITKLASQGYAQVSISVQKTNPAHRLYQRMGFEVLHDRQTDWVMVKDLTQY